ncbi:winged helix-turn-helix transcriptional regulator [Aeoliella sp.]|uniref:winged helix-turn-helix transcriptional regulator n=1 Tax=Aeoliella sp. TaxID=2795800 RepID=UPI003CCC2F5E
MAKRNQLDQRRSDCPIACALDIVGDRWTLLVIRDLVLGTRQFEEFLASPEGIASNILAARLKMLESMGYVKKSKDADDRRKSVYELTEAGQPLRKLVKQVAKWGLENIAETELLPEAQKRMR